MVKKLKKEFLNEHLPESKEANSVGPQKPWRPGADIKLNKSVWDGLYPAYYLFDKETRQDVGLMMKIPVFIKDPLVAQGTPTLGVQGIWVRLENHMEAGPTSSRVAVVDFNADTQTLTDPVVWDEKERWFHTPLSEKDWLPDAPDVRANTMMVKDPEKYRQLIEKTVKNPYFHQLNVWAVVQRVLEFYEEPWALGRPVPWGFDGNRLIVVPHAGYGENAFYDPRSKSLQFYYFGDEQHPSYTCLSHDIITHETGHAILDGIRPMYNHLSSVQTAAFHEFIGDLTALLLGLFNDDIRHFINEDIRGNLLAANVLADLAPEFGQEVEGRPYLRTAFNRLTMQDVQEKLSPHTISQVLSGAMWEILTGIAAKHRGKSSLEQEESPALVLWRAANRFRRVALQPLDLCPPCDIQFIDYARAVIRNDIMTNPVDEKGYRQIMLDVFHRRGLCSCVYKPGRALPKGCLFNEVMHQDRLEFVYFDIERVSRSRTAAYYFLSDNRRLLGIPMHQDVRVVDLYDTNKFGAAGERLPREIVLEYAWQEIVPLVNDLKQDLNFGSWNGKTFNMDCGGTLVFDGRGNLLSWFRKPGTEYGSERDGRSTQNRNTKPRGDVAREINVKKPTKQELAIMADLDVGKKRIRVLKEYLAALIRRGLVGKLESENRFSEGQKPITAFDEGGVVHFETTPHLRKSDFDVLEEGWTISY